MGAFLFVNFVSACFPLVPVRCGFAVKGRACPLVGALALIGLFFCLFPRRKRSMCVSHCLLTLLAPPIGGLP